jgi:hypothetical protein
MCIRCLGISGFHRARDVIELPISDVLDILRGSCVFLFGPE